MHGLVLCQPPPEALQAETSHSVWLEDKFDEMERSSKQRLDTLENKIDALATRVSGTASDISDDRRFEGRLGALDGKMQKIEDMLGVLLTKLG